MHFMLLIGKKRGSRVIIFNLADSYRKLRTSQYNAKWLMLKCIVSKCDLIEYWLYYFKARLILVYLWFDLIRKCQSGWKTNYSKALFLNL